MQKIFISFCLFVSLFMSGCATMKDSTLVGAGIGAVVGGTLGAIASHNGSTNKSGAPIIIGASLGGLLGAGIGYENHKQREKNGTLNPFNTSTSQVQIHSAAGSQGKQPTLRPAQVKVRYVEDQIKDGKFIPAHFEYEISEPAKWQPSK